MSLEKGALTSIMTQAMVIDISAIALDLNMPSLRISACSPGAVIFFVNAQVHATPRTDLPLLLHLQILPIGGTP